jgi:N-acetylneuraminic acid mutarotase
MIFRSFRRTSATRLRRAVGPVLENLENRRLLSQTPYLGVAADASGTGVTIEAEHYDLGGEGVAYHDADNVNEFNGPRQGDGVDTAVQASLSNVGQAEDGEWLEYTVDAGNNGGTFDVDLRLASVIRSGRVTVEVVGGDTTQPAAFPSNGWTRYETVEAGRLELAPGENVLRVSFHRAGGGVVGDVDWLRLRRVDAGSTPTPSPGQAPYPVARTLPAFIEASHYDLGGEGVAFHEVDTHSAGNRANRGDGVDMASHQGRTYVGWTENGEWLEYTVDVDQPGTFDFSIEASTAMSKARMRLYVDGVPQRTAEVQQRGWGNYDNYDMGSVHLDTGRHVLRVMFDRAAGGHVGNLLGIHVTRQIDVAPQPQTPHAMSPATTGVPIEAEWWDEGGVDVAFGESDTVDRGGANTRGGGVDLARSGGDTFVGWAADGEWLEYTITTGAHADYDVIARAATSFDDARIRVSINGVDQGQGTVPRHGWTSFHDVDLGRVHLHPGSYVVRLTFERSSGGDVANLDRFTFQQVPQGPTVPTTPPTTMGHVRVGDFTTHDDSPRNYMEGVQVEIDGVMHFWGGFDDWTFIDRASGWAYDPATMNWRRLPDLPTGLTHLKAVEHDGRAYFFGGYSYGGADADGPLVGDTDQVYVYDPATNAFSEFTTMPFEVAGHGLAMVGSRVHVMSGMFRDDANDFTGGSDRHVSLDLDDVATGWRTESTTPMVRDHVASAVVGQTIYLFAGQTSDDQYAGPRAEMWSFDTMTGVWSERAPLPAERGHVDQSSVVWRDRYLVVAGGNQIADRWQDSATDEIFVYDTVTDTWFDAGTLPEGRFGSQVFLVGDQLHVLGGGDGQPRAQHWSATLMLHEMVTMDDEDPMTGMDHVHVM